MEIRLKYLEKNRYRKYGKYGGKLRAGIICVLPEYFDIDNAWPAEIGGVEPPLVLAG